MNTADRRGLTPLMWASASGNSKWCGSCSSAARRRPAGHRRHDRADAGVRQRVRRDVRALLPRGANVAAAKAASTRGSSRSSAAIPPWPRCSSSRSLGGRLLQAAPKATTRSSGSCSRWRAGQRDQREGRDGPDDRGPQRRPRHAQASSPEAPTRPSATARAGPCSSGPSPRPHGQVRRRVSPRPRHLARTSSPERAGPVAQVKPACGARRGSSRAFHRRPPGARPSDARLRRCRSCRRCRRSGRRNRPRTTATTCGRLGARGRAEGRRRRSLAASVQALAEDLEVKLEHCTRSGGKLGGSVVVRVRTVQGATESKSWQVFYMPRVFEAAGNASPDLFPQLSSPTEETLVPGRYVMWVRDPATARARRADGRQGRRREEGAAPGSARARRAAAMTSGARLLGRHRRVWLAVAAVAARRHGRRARASAARPWRADAGARRRLRRWPPRRSWRSRSCRSSLWRGAARRRSGWRWRSWRWRSGWARSPPAGTRSARARRATRQAGRHRHGADAARRDLQQANPELSSDDCCSTPPVSPSGSGRRASIDRCRALIGSTYFLWIPFLVVCLLATAQAVPPRSCRPCAGTRPRRGAATARADALRRLHELPARRRRQGVAAGAAGGARSGRLPRRDRRARLPRQRQLPAGDGTRVRESRFTVAVISARYLESGNTRGRGDHLQGARHGRPKRRLIPLVIEPVTMPVWLYGIVGIDWTKRDPLVDPLDKLKATLGRAIGPG